MILHILATIWKELLLLRRDKAGLATLFLMPAMLVLVISLVQDNILRSTGTADVDVAFVDNDHGRVAEQLTSTLTEKGGFNLIKEYNGKPIDAEVARDLVKDGEFQMAIVVPEGCSAALKKRSEELADKSFTTDDKKKKAAPEPETVQEPATKLIIFFDPTIQGSFRTAVTSSLERLMMAMEVEEKSAVFAKKFPGKMREIIKTKILSEVGDDLSEKEQNEMIGKIPEMQFHWSKEQVIGLDREALPAPTAVQQNVPAWTLFGMFFIVVPLGGTIIRERLDGTMTRLRGMPCSYASLLTGKVLAYVLVCLVQFVLMIMVGMFILPRFGTPTLTIGDAPGALLFIAVCSALAATGYGVLVGTVAGSYEQASMFGSISVVTASAIGGIMVPVYVMPKAMKDLSVVSPLSWGLDGFLDVFVRDGDIMAVMPMMLRLIIFAVVCMAAAWMIFQKREAK